MLDLLIKNGTLIDPDSGLEAVGSVAVNNGKIIRNTERDAAYTVDATGYYVFPGLIDYHAHVYEGGSGFGVSPDWLLPTGVTTVVDAGSVGCANFEAFYRSVIAVSRIQAFAQINLYPAGQPAYGVVEDYSLMESQFEKTARLIEMYPHVINALKIRLGEEVVGKNGLQFLEKALAFANQVQIPLVVHASNPPCRSSEIADRLRAGDVFCHCYHGKGRTILDENGHVQEALWQARKRGVLFDCCNGISNFNLEVAKKAIAENFLPDIISTDEAPNVFNKNGFGKSLPYIMSKYLELGMKLSDILKAVTRTPAGLLGLAGDSGSLAEGSRADISIFRIEKRNTVYRDNKGGLLQGTRMLLPKMTIANGEILFSQVDFPEECL
jgi:predicted amidohydrolase